MSVTAPECFADLDRLITGAAPGDRPSLVVALAARLAQLGAGLVVDVVNGNGGGPGPRPEEDPERWLTPEQAAEIAGVSKDRIYRWALGQKWASRPSRRCLRIEEKGFRRWLRTRAR